MLSWPDNVAQSGAALRSHRLRAALTILGLTMGVATIITVMTLIQGANDYVENKIANLGTNVFQIAKTPFAATDFELFLKSMKYKRFEYADYVALTRRCNACGAVGASVTSQARIRAADIELQDVNVIGHTANMAAIDTRTVETGRYFTPSEDDRSAYVCLVGDAVRQQLFGGADVLNRTLRVANQEFTIIGTFEKIGSVLGQDADTFVIVPLNTYLRTRGSRASLTVNVQAREESQFEAAMDEARLVMRSQRQLKGNAPDDFFIGTKESYISLWKSISGAFFAVFILVSAISAFVGGIVIMNVMLVSVTERTKEIGIRRAVGATQTDIRRQFLLESVMQCVIGGAIGIGCGFLAAEAVRGLADFPVSVRTWVAVLGIVVSSVIGVFFGLYPAIRASRLDPVEALRADK
ncbi:MAG: ABC transporter permease [Bryobacteraceae bacterium]|nr:ABC transporter permease [Bryobacteraceae bacterium]